MRKEWTDEEREKASQRWYEQAKRVKKRNYENHYARQKRVNDLWAIMGKDRYARSEILARIMILEKIVRRNYYKRNKIMIKGFGNFWYDILDYERGGLIGLKGKVGLSILKAKFIFGKSINQKLEKYYAEKNQQ